MENYLRKQYKTRSNIFAGIFIITCFLISAISDSTTFPFLIGIAFYFIGVVSYAFGLYYYVKYKGYDGTFALWGLAGPIGLLIIIFAEDKSL